MFENVIGQKITDQIIGDLDAGLLAPAMLFSGPPSSGKGTAALELSRVISCRANPRGSWNCTCIDCSSHRILNHPDILCLGSRNFYAEILASGSALQRDSTSKTLFIRSVRKLLSRFNPILWEDDPKASRISSMVLSMDEDLNEFEQINLTEPMKENTNLYKLVNSIIKNSLKLESDGLTDNIPIGHIRKAAWWSRLSPVGNAKLMLLENADRMENESRNSLLKILEEPPAKLSLVLTTTRAQALIPTILSRLRVYRFVQRETEAENEVIRRVFKDNEVSVNGINNYIDSFLPVSHDTLNNLAAYFAASAAYRSVLISKKTGKPVSKEVIMLGKYCTPIAEKAGYGRPNANQALLVEFIMGKAEKFEIRSLFSRFLSSLFSLISESLKNLSPESYPRAAFYTMCLEKINWADNASKIYRLRSAQVLEKLFTDLSRSMSET